MKKKYVSEVRAFNRFYTVFMGLLNKSFLESRYSLVETRVMHAAHTKPGVLPSEIVSQLNIDKGYLSRILSTLQKRKIITKVKSAEDSRSVHIYITDFGAGEFEKLNKASDAKIGGLLAGLSESECKQLVKNMSGIQEALTGKEQLL